MAKRRIQVVAGVLGVIVIAVVGVGTLGGSRSSTSQPAPTGAGPPAIARKASVSSSKVSTDGHMRDVTLVSPTHPNGATLVVLPGLGETVDQVRTTSDADSLAISQGVTIIYLGGFSASWNAGTCCGAAQAAHLDDVATVRSVTAALVMQNKLDPHRVFIAGHSNGAFMALRLACETHGIYAGFLSVAGALVTDCPDPAPTVLVLWQGALDTTVPVAGRTVGTLTLPPLTTTLAPFTATCGQPVQTAADSITASYAWTCPGVGTRQLLLSSTGTHEWPMPAGQLIARAWTLFATQHASAGV